MSDITLYFAPQPTRADRARWAFLEAGVEFSHAHIDVTKGEQRSEEYLEVNPLGFVPAAIIEDEPMIESSAMALWAAMENPEANLLPEKGTRAWRQMLQWTVFGPAELDGILFTILTHTRIIPPAHRKPELAEAALETFSRRAQMLSNVLEGRAYLHGDEFKISDVVIGFDLVWARMLGLLEPYPILGAYFERLSQRDAFRQIYPNGIQPIPDLHA